MPKKTPSKSLSPNDPTTAPTGSQEHYDRYLPVAEKIAAGDVRPLRADVSLAIANAERGAQAVLDHKAKLHGALPHASVASIESLAALGSALAFAAGVVDRYAPPPTDTKKLLARGHELRRIMLSAADALAAAGLLPSANVAKIHQGHGGIDTAGDLVALAALFRKNASAVKGKVPFTSAEVREAEDVGTRLLAVLRPKAAGKKPSTKDLAAATVARDRLWTLFEQTWEDHVWRSGAWIFGRAVDAHVPPLQSRVVGKRAKKSAPGGEPAAPKPAAS